MNLIDILGRHVWVYNDVKRLALIYVILSISGLIDDCQLINFRIGFENFFFIFVTAKGYVKEKSERSLSKDEGSKKNWTNLNSNIYYIV